MKVPEDATSPTEARKRSLPSAGRQRGETDFGAATVLPSPEELEVRFGAVHTGREMKKHFEPKLIKLGGSERDGVQLAFGYLEAVDDAVEEADLATGNGGLGNRISREASRTFPAYVEALCPDIRIAEAAKQVLAKVITQENVLPPVNL